ncbi:hypothetical protein ILUMI_21854 [Ignelater luminosus]|uniref:Uncharacterized protein n=1 Tax=Ignelater luminosus TaxID=2038154 RepID=A0A8K0CI74_IGNLU|nr:hypothetical protein ILUMI_21854 [Ignelater luminosus]
MNCNQGYNELQICISKYDTEDECAQNENNEDVNKNVDPFYASSNEDPDYVLSENEGNTSTDSNQVVNPRKDQYWCYEYDLKKPEDQAEKLEEYELHKKRKDAANSAKKEDSERAKNGKTFQYKESALSNFHTAIDKSNLNERNMQFLKETPSILYYKNKYWDVSNTELDMQHWAKRGRPSHTLIAVPLLYERQLKIDLKKYKNLMEL